MALLFHLVKGKSEMKKCFTDGQGRSRLLESKSQAVRDVSHTHHYLVFFSPLSALQACKYLQVSLQVSSSLGFSWICRIQNDNCVLKAGGNAARKHDASAGSKSSIWQTPAQVVKKAKSFSSEAVAIQTDPSFTL